MTNIVFLTLGLTFQDHMFSCGMFLSEAQLLLISGCQFLGFQVRIKKTNINMTEI